MTPQTSERTRVAVLGVSHWHLPLYLPGFAECDVVGVWDRDPGRADEVAGSIRSPAYHSRETLLDQGIELAFVFGDPWEMLDNSMECLRRRIPISVEKPAAPSLPELEELVLEAERAGVNAFVPLVLRTSKVATAIKQLGHVNDLHAQYFTGPASRYTTGGYGWAVKGSVLGAGCLGNLAPHFVDLFSLATGSTDSVTHYVQVRRPADGAADDRALVALGSRDGCTATIDLGYTTANAQLSVGPSVVVTGGLATLVVTESEAKLLHADGGSVQPCAPLQWPALFLDYVRAVAANPAAPSELPGLLDLRNAYQTLARPAEVPPPNHLQ